jgi:3-oxoacid CoA-transferase subunit A
MQKLFTTRSLVSRRLLSSKVFSNAADAVADIGNNSKVLVGGFGICGIPETLIAALREKGSTG